MDLSTLCARFDDRLRTDAYADLDASSNGLQVGPGRGSDTLSTAASHEVEHVAFAVDAAIETVERAADAGADLLVTHHGLIWGGLDRVTGRTYDRLEGLFERDLALYVSHLPLDAHPDLGNAAGVADALDLREREPFGELGGEHIGLRGRLPDGFAPEGLREELAAECGPRRGVRALEFGPERIESVAIVTGSGADWFAEADAAGVDVFITGEGKQALYHEAREAGIHAFLAGHYATETFGVRALQDLAEEWDLETTFIDVPTGL